MKRRFIFLCIFLFFVSACGVSKDKIDKLAGECDAGNEVACSKLAKIALKKGFLDNNIRIYVVEKVANQAFLTEIAKKAMAVKEGDPAFIKMNERLLQAVVNKTTDQKLLAEVCLTNNVDSMLRVFAMRKLEDQKLISEIGKKAMTEEILNTCGFDLLQAAIEKTTDQKLLAEVCIRFVGFDMAMDKLTDQRLIEEVAKNPETSIAVKLPAIEKLTDKACLMRVLWDSNRLIRTKIFEKLTDKTMQTKESLEANWEVRLIQKFIEAFDPVDRNKIKYMLDFFPLIRTLSNPEIASEVGKIVKIETKWDLIKKVYSITHIQNNHLSTGSTLVYGEDLTFSIKVEKLDNPLYATWSTYFPDNVYPSEMEHITLENGQDEYFLPLKADPLDLFDNAFNESSYKKIIINVFQNAKESD